MTPTGTLPTEERAQRLTGLRVPWHEEADITRACLDKAARKMKKWADTKPKQRRLIEFDKGDLVMIKLQPQQFQTLRKVHK